MFFRIRFAKYGVMKFIGHLDVMRYFQKAVRRSGLMIKYSQGYSPHQLMVFASPLGVGITSDGEYMDIEVEDDSPECQGENPAALVSETLSKALSEGFEILECRRIPWKEGEKRPENAMSLVNGADYLVSVKDGYEIADVSDSFCGFLSQESIIISKKTKSGEKETDIKPFIYQAVLKQGSGSPEIFGDTGAFNPAEWEIGLTHADKFENGTVFFLRLAAGSNVNIKPEPVIEAFMDYAGIPYNPVSLQTHRVQMYSNVMKLVTL